jgi:hypothetical protein
MGLGAPDLPAMPGGPQEAAQGLVGDDDALLLGQRIG